MPRRERKLNLGQRIAALQHAAASHTGEKTVFGGLRLVLPGIGSAASTRDASLTTPILFPHTAGDMRTSSSWGRWSEVGFADVNDENDGLRKCGTAAPISQLNIAVEHHRTLPPCSTSAGHSSRDSVNRSDEEGYFDRSLSLASNLPPRDDSSAHRVKTPFYSVSEQFAVKETSMTCQQAGDASGNPRDEFVASSQSMESAACTQQSELMNCGAKSTETIGGSAHGMRAPTSGIVILEHGRCPDDTLQRAAQVNQNAYYQQRSARRGRLGIDERIDVFEPQIVSHEAYANDLEFSHLRRLSSSAHDDDTVNSHDSNSERRRMHRASPLPESSLAKLIECNEHRRTERNDERRNGLDQTVKAPPDGGQLSPSQFYDMMASFTGQRREEQDCPVASSELISDGQAPRKRILEPLHSPRPSIPSLSSNWSPSADRDIQQGTKDEEFCPVKCLIDPLSRPRQKGCDRDVSQLPRQRGRLTTETVERDAVNAAPDKTRSIGAILSTLHTTSNESSMLKMEGGPSSQNSSRLINSTPPIESAEVENRGLSEAEDIDRLLALLDPIAKGKLPLRGAIPIPNEEYRTNKHLRAKTLHEAPPRHSSPRKTRIVDNRFQKGNNELGHQLSMSSDGDFNENLKSDAFAAFDEDDEIIENPFSQPSRSNHISNRVETPGSVVTRQLVMKDMNDEPSQINLTASPVLQDGTLHHAVCQEIPNRKLQVAHDKVDRQTLEATQSHLGENSAMTDPRSSTINNLKNREPVVQPVWTFASNEAEVEERFASFAILTERPFQSLEPASAREGMSAAPNQADRGIGEDFGRLLSSNDDANYIAIQKPFLNVSDAIATETHSSTQTRSQPSVVRQRKLWSDKWWDQQINQPWSVEISENSHRSTSAQQLRNSTFIETDQTRNREGKMGVERTRHQRGTSSCRVEYTCPRSVETDKRCNRRREIDVKQPSIPLRNLPDVLKKQTGQDGKIRNYESIETNQSRPTTTQKRGIAIATRKNTQQAASFIETDIGRTSVNGRSDGRQAKPSRQENDEVSIPTVWSYDGLVQLQLQPQLCELSRDAWLGSAKCGGNLNESSLSKEEERLSRAGAYSVAAHEVECLVHQQSGPSIANETEEIDRLLAALTTTPKEASPSDTETRSAAQAGAEYRATKEVGQQRPERPYPPNVYSRASHYTTPLSENFISKKLPNEVSKVESRDPNRSQKEVMTTGYEVGADSASNLYHLSPKSSVFEGVEDEIDPRLSTQACGKGQNVTDRCDSESSTIANPIPNLFARARPPERCTPSMTEMPEPLNRRAYASAPIRNYWRDYSNVRSRGSFDSVSLSNGKSGGTGQQNLHDGNVMGQNFSAHSADDKARQNVAPGQAPRHFSPINIDDGASQTVQCRGDSERDVDLSQQSFVVPAQMDCDADQARSEVNNDDLVAGVCSFTDHIDAKSGPISPPGIDVGQDNGSVDLPSFQLAQEHIEPNQARHWRSSTDNLADQSPPRRRGDVKRDIGSFQQADFQRAQEEAKADRPRNKCYDVGQVVGVSRIANRLEAERETISPTCTYVENDHGSVGLPGLKRVQENVAPNRDPHQPSANVDVAGDHNDTDRVEIGKHKFRAPNRTTKAEWNQPPPPPQTRLPTPIIDNRTYPHASQAGRPSQKLPSKHRFRPADPLTINNSGSYHKMSDGGHIEKCVAESSAPRRQCQRTIQGVDPPVRVESNKRGDPPLRVGPPDLPANLPSTSRTHDQIFDHGSVAHFRAEINERCSVGTTGLLSVAEKECQRSRLHANAGFCNTQSVSPHGDVQSHPYDTGELQTSSTFDSDNAVTDECLEIFSTATSDEGGVQNSPVLQTCDSLNSTTAVNSPDIPILPPRRRDSQAEYSETRRGSFDSVSVVTEPDQAYFWPTELWEPVSNNANFPPGRWDRDWKSPSPSGYSRQLSSPLRDSLIHAMSPMLSGDTDDDDSITNASTQQGRNDDDAESSTCAYNCTDLLDFSRIQRQIEGFCVFRR